MKGDTCNSPSPFLIPVLVSLLAACPVVAWYCLRTSHVTSADVPDKPQRIGRVGGWVNGEGDIAAVLSVEPGLIRVRMKNGREMILLSGYIVLDAKEARP